ncbi:cathepsin B-like [Dermatophagoides pteronyssinus]|uniref:cathepsin B-like n=1 Tax=Dermatophagoides pteronyssinus TaxID=6956 RepID=UPI003F67E9A0
MFYVICCCFFSNHNKPKKMFQSIILVLATLLSIAFAQPELKSLKALETDDFLSDEYIQYLNEIKNTTWKAGRNFNKNITTDHIRSMLGLLDQEIPMKTSLLTKSVTIDVARIPEFFDARKKWPNCKTIQQIRDQGTCGSCWAFGAAEAISDRFCIATNGSVNIMISAEDLLSCCGYCGSGCNGGWSLPAWSYWVEEGLVSGGLYGTKDTCRPYTIPPCEHGTSGALPQCSSKDKAKTPNCDKQCITGYPRAYEQDIHRGKEAYGVSNSVSQIQYEIMTYGPVEGGFTVFSDFPNYKSGVYKRNSNKNLGGHAIKIIGWGIEDDSPYWLCVNSWNADWGDKGFFKFYRGINECGIESNIVAGIPKIH